MNNTYILTDQQQVPLLANVFLRYVDNIHKKKNTIPPGFFYMCNVCVKKNNNKNKPAKKGHFFWGGSRFYCQPSLGQMLVMCTAHTESYDSLYKTTGQQIKVANTESVLTVY